LERPVRTVQSRRGDGRAAHANKSGRDRQSA